MLPEESWARSVYWLVTVLLTQGGEVERDAVMRQLDADGIETRPVFYPMHIQPPHRDDSRAYPCATLGAARGINLPTHARLNEDDVRRICASLDRAIRLARLRQRVTDESGPLFNHPPVCFRRGALHG